MIIVTGGAGFIGSNIIKRLNSRSVSDILIVDDVNQDKESNLEHLTFADIMSTDDFYGRFNNWLNIEAIFHEGAISSTTEKDPTRIDQYNLQPSYWLIDQAVQHDVFLSYASSASVYGDSNTFKENQPLMARSLYASSKMRIDQYVYSMLLDYPDARIQGWRYFNVYGNNENHKKDQASPVTKFRHQAETTGKIKVFKGSENFQRDFVCVDDVADVKLRSFELGFSGIYNLGTGSAISFRQVAETVAEKYSADIEEIDFPQELINQYQKYTCSDNTRLLSVLGDYQFKTVKSFLSET